MDKKIKSLKTLLIALGAVLLFSNSMGLMVNSMMFSNSDIKPASGIDLLFANFGLICITAIAIGILNLVGGILLNPKNKWTRGAVILTSILSIICIIGFSIILVNVTVKEGIELGFSIGLLFSGIAFSSPFVILLVHLNRAEIKRHFT